MVWTKHAGMRLLGMVSPSLYAHATAINDAGQIIGIDQTGTADLAFYTAPHTGLKFLKGLGGNSTYARAINQQGIIVGSTNDATGLAHGVMWSTPSSVPQELPLIAEGIDNLGQVASWGAAP
jgi:uncharacterized membrane protein